MGKFEHVQFFYAPLSLSLPQTRARSRITIKFHEDDLGSTTPRQRPTARFELLVGDAGDSRFVDSKLLRSASPWVKIAENDVNER